MRRSVALCFALVVAAIAAARADDAAQAAKLFELLALEPGMTVADIGAGTGALTVPIAKRIGPSGKVYSTDINPDRLKDLRAAAQKNHLDNIVVVEGAAAATNLPESCCDAIFIRDVYHHFTDPPAIDRSLFASLKPGGRLAIIDFVAEKGSELPQGVPANRGGHGIPADVLRQEVTSVGFELVRTIDRWEGEARSYLVLFKKP
jgi:ubiquinone/menaquinone biosynthesis C-methylase UbiE